MSDHEIIKLPSRFDYSYHQDFLAAYLPALNDPDKVKLILDFSRVEYLDSSALGMMVMLQKKFNQVGKVVQIKSASGATEEILTMANMQRIFEFIS